MTHGDRFRNLTDEQLAAYLGGTGECPPSCGSNAQKCSQCSTHYAVEMWYQYLISEVNNEEQTETPD